MKQFFQIAVVICICFWSWAFREQKQIHFTFSGRAQGTTYVISYYHESEQVTQCQVDSILLVIDESMSLYKPNSLISKINDSPSGGEIDSHFLKVMQRSIEINKETAGVFDVTVGPLVAAWGFSSEKVESLPDSAKISQLMPSVGMEKIQLIGNALKKINPKVKIDLNGIAQGYTVDVLADFFSDRGIKSFLIELGGEVRVEGEKPSGEEFLIGIEGPINSESDEVTIKHIVSIKGKGLTTSGSYQNYIKKGIERITHIINSKTGYPSQSEILSVTVVAEDAISADGYDNALLAMGIKDALLFVNSHPDLEAYFVYKDDNDKLADTMSTGFNKLLKN